VSQNNSILDLLGDAVKLLQIFFKQDYSAHKWTTEVHEINKFPSKVQGVAGAGAD
jgi:hypothetical protein